MKRRITILSAVFLTAILSGGGARAQVRSSADFSVAAETTDAAGRRTTSADYSVDASVGGVGGVSSTASPVETVKHGYIGQLFNVASVTLIAVNTNVNEGASRQLFALAALDDTTFLQPDGGQVAWGVVFGPIASIDSSGRATATNVFQNTSAIVSGSFLGRSGALGLQVLNAGIDDFQTYAGDGLDDAWQVQNFGLNNPNAAPGLDPDGDGQSNGYEYVVGTVPTLTESRFRLTIATIASQPLQKLIAFSPRFTNRTYSVESRLNLDTGSFSPLLTTTQTDLGNTREVIDTNAVSGRKFYRVRITFP